MPLPYSWPRIPCSKEKPGSVRPGSLENVMQALQYFKRHKMRTFYKIDSYCCVRNFVNLIQQSLNFFGPELLVQHRKDLACQLPFISQTSLCFLSVNLIASLLVAISKAAWKIPWLEEPGGLRSIGSLRVGLDQVTSLSLFTFMHWRRKWQPTPVFLPGESQGRWSLMGCRLWGRTESDTTEVTGAAATLDKITISHDPDLANQSSVLPQTFNSVL